MGFELRDHTADVGVAATGDRIESVFGALANGLAAASCETVPDGGDRFQVAVSAESRDALLFEYLDELIYLRDVRGELPVDNEVTITRPDESPGTHTDDGATPRTSDASSHQSDASSHQSDASSHQSDVEWHLEGTARGVPVDSIDAREVKAVTYSEMRLEEGEDGWEAYVVFDV